MFRMHGEDLLAVWAAPYPHTGTDVMRLPLLAPVAALGWLFAITPVQAQSGATRLSYNMLELSDTTINSTVSGIKLKYHETGLRGSYVLTDDIFGTAEYAHQTVNGFGRHSEIDRQSIGLGWRHGLSAHTDVIATYAYTDNHLSGAGSSVTPTSINSAGVGARTLVTPSLELFARIDFNKPSNSTNYTSYGGGTRYHLTPSWALKLELNSYKIKGIKQDTYSLAVVYKF